MNGIPRAYVPVIYGVHFDLLPDTARHGDFFRQGLYIKDDDINMIIAADDPEHALDLAINHLDKSYTFRHSTCKIFGEVGPLLLEGERVIDISGSNGIEQQMEYDQIQRYILHFENKVLSNIEATDYEGGAYHNW